MRPIHNRAAASVAAVALTLIEVEGGGWAVSDWSPGDSRLLVLEFVSINRSHLWLVDAATGVKTELTPRQTEDTVAYRDARFSQAAGLGAGHRGAAQLGRRAARPRLLQGDGDRGSYGGYMTLAVAAMYDDRIRCSLDVVGISNFITFLQNTESYRRDLRRAEYGDERDPGMRAFFERIAPVNQAPEIGKPLFVVQGANEAGQASRCLGIQQSR